MRETTEHILVTVGFLIGVVAFVFLMGLAIRTLADEFQMTGYDAARLDSIEPVGRDKAINCYLNGNCEGVK